MWLWPLKMLAFWCFFKCCCCWCWGTCWRLFGWDFEPKFRHNIGSEVCSRFWSKFLVKTLRLRFGQAFEAEVWLGFWGWVLINLWFLINFWYELKAVSLMRALNPWVRFAFCNQQNQSGNAFGDIVIKNWYWQKIPSKLEVALPPKCWLDGWVMEWIPLRLLRVLEHLRC